MRLPRWLGFVCVLSVILAMTGCNAILGDFNAAGGSDEDGGIDASLPLVDGAPAQSDGTVTVDSSRPDSNAGTDATPPGDANGIDSSITCSPTEKACNGACVPLTSPATGCNDPNNCGPCSFANAVPATVCVGGSCALDHCLNGYTDCNGNAADGCEIHTADDPSHCGGCNIQCNDAGGAPTCSGAVCSSIACSPGFADCDHSPSNGCEVNTNGDPSNCGTCGYLCGNVQGSASCSEAGDGGTAACVFSCTAPFAHCPSSSDKNGCDVNTNIDNENCGKCGNACALGQKCINGACACNATTCPSGCCDTNGACVTATNAACGNAGEACATCAAGQECNAASGKCECDANSCPNGCCSPTGACITTPSNADCTKGGQACQACATGSVCSADGTACVCTAASCPNGCCAGNVCVAVGSGQSSTQCGTGGDVCGKCAGGQACSNGTCNCGGTSCTGCCDGTGVCQTGTTNTECGSSGSVCSACGTAQECNSQGKCVCDATTCPGGCCDTNGVCQTAEKSAACGVGGVACGACGTGQECNAASGKCVCDATSCPSGCCNGSTCVVYANETQAACGTAGTSCAACAQGARCNGAGKCVCDATSCPNGCCDSNGQCQASTTATCGTGGVSCAACGSGTECAGGVCKCDANSCGHGCCSGNQCVSSETSAACGTSGAACVACLTGQECTGSSCQCDATSCPSGCCNASNACVPFASEGNGVCGTAGEKCTACVTGQECSAQTHTCACDATSCPAGCCSANNTCVAYASETNGACGAAGAACAGCPAGQGCNTQTGQCGCTSASCPSGCCDATNNCNASANLTCGTSGAACVNCTSKGAECVGGACKCDATSCPGGCCDASGVCQTNGAATCGLGGASCKTCGSGQTCSSAGACQCDPSCTGCCNGGASGACVAGTAPGACGTSVGTPLTCAVCPAGQECTNGGGTAYSCKCDATSCPSGCCDSTGTCHTSALGTCGIKGAACQACNGGVGQECNASGQCACDSKSCGAGCCTATLNGTCITAETASECGANGAVCAPCANGSFVCAAGACACPSGDVACGGQCINPKTNQTYCGASGACTGATAGATCLSTQTCVGGACQFIQELLTVTKAGTGSGTVTSTTGINCGTTCSASYNDGSQVTLTATAAPGHSVFTGWSGACSGGGACVVTMSAAMSVTATFTAVIPTTWDPSWSLPGVTYTNGNLSISGNSATTKNVRTIDGKSSGKWYWEVTATAGVSNSNSGGLGILESVMPNNSPWIGEEASGLAFGFAGPTYFMTWAGATLTNPTNGVVGGVASGIVYMFALDMDTGKFWAGQNGTWYNSGNPATSAVPVVTGISGTVYPGVTFYASSINAFTANFGGSAFNYAVPAGFNPGVYNIPTTFDPTWSIPGVTYTNGNLSVSGNSAGNKNTRTLVGRKSGKYYWEMTATGGVATSDEGGLGILEAAMPNNTGYIGEVASGLSFGYGSGTYWMTWAGATLNLEPPANSAVAAGIVYMFALDMNAGEFWAGQNGTWYNAGNPAGNTAAAATGITGTVYAGTSLYGSSVDAFTANFGASPFVYAVPAGFGAGLY